MGSAKRIQLWFLAFLAFSSLADVSPSKVMSAPNILRVGAVENIFVECQDCMTDDRVEIFVKSHPAKTSLAQTTVNLTEANNYQNHGQIIVPAKDFRKNPNMKQFVYLQARFSGVELEKVILVSFQSGYIFVQTDKTLYTPDSTVHYRIFATTPSMEPVERDLKNEIDASVDIEIVTPEDMVIPIESVALQSGITSGRYKLSDIVSTGLWKVVAKFTTSPQQSYSAEFEVKEYVLPSFEVKLSSEIPYFHVDREHLTINIGAKYLFGEEVEGTAFAVFGVMNLNHKNSLPSSLQRVSITSGKGVVTMMREHITSTFPDIHELVGRSLFVAVSVLTESGSEMVEAELRGIQIVTSPYSIHFRRTAKYFKPGMSFDVAVEVLNPDGTPAQGVAVVLDPGNEQGLTAANGMARLSINTRITNEPLLITARTNVPDISQASAVMTAVAYSTQSNSYLHIGVDAAEVNVGGSLKVYLILNQPQNAQSYTTYLILSKGQLVKYGRQRTRALSTMTVIVTKEMLPSFRIVAYYFTNDNEVVADSVWVDVKDSCMGSLRLESVRPNPSYLPGKMFNLKVTGDPGATVGLVAVDKGVYVLNNKHRLTQKKIWDLVEKHDTGCTAGGGRDSMNVFYDAGLLFASIASATPHRLDLKCPVPVSRRRRQATIQEIRTSLVSRYTNKQRECCLDGMRDTPLSYACERRSEYIVDDPACVYAFLNCCKELETQRAERRHDALLLARSDDDDSYMDTNEITSRSKFFDSWLWSDIKLPACPPHTPNCQTSNQTRFPLKDSITTWQFTGISLSRTHGICVADPFEVVVRKEFFIDLRLPYSAVRREQLEIKAVLHNYSPDDITVRVELIENPDVCSSASRRGKYRLEVKVGYQTTRSVPFIIIPMREGQQKIEVKAAVRDSPLTDGIMKKLLVVPEGILRKSVVSVTLDPAKKGVDMNCSSGSSDVLKSSPHHSDFLVDPIRKCQKPAVLRVATRHEETLYSNITEKALVRKAPTRTLITVTGREQISTLVENALSGKSMGTLIKEPSGCGEQNMISMTLPVIATVYLDKTNQWEAIGFEKRKEALTHIETGYNNELAFRKPDGSFAVFKEHKSSTWLTAYVTKVFAMAHGLVKVQRDFVCQAIDFLISHTQQTDGSFVEVGAIIHGEMIGDVRGTDSDASMTAFCLIAMQESHKICNTSTNYPMDHSINKSVAYLQGRLHNLNNPYAVAMTSYALANENKLDRRILFSSSFVSSDLTHWPVPGSHLFTLEATAYALLALVKAKAFEEAKPVVRWFNQQQIDGGGYGSTQATIMVYQAIAEYWISANEEDYQINVDIVIPGRQIDDRFNFNRETHYTSRTSKLNEINKNVRVIATGSGEATVKMVSLYYALPEEKESDCTKFDLSVRLVPEKMDEDEKIYKLIIKILYKSTEHDATMSILDIGLLTGFTVDTNDLSSLSEGNARTISKYEMDTVLSERGSLIIYLSKVSHSQTEEVAFRMHQKLKVGVLQPAAVSVYEYYDHQHNNQTPCVKFYHPERKSGELLRLCTNSECTCAEENCSMQKTQKIRNDERTAKACETEQDSRIDFVYKVRLENFTADLSSDIYTMRVVEVIKGGSYDECRGTCDMGPLGRLRRFLGYQHCRASLNLEIGKTYLIMGMAKDIYPDSERQSYQYVLGERTWIEYWPTNEECQAAEHRPTCLGMEELLEVYTTFGCPNK